MREKRKLFNGKELDPEDYYLSEEGYVVFTSMYHLKRGYCCRSGCINCPYGFSSKKEKLS
ncbi:MAG TPA: hypothetical protein DDX92_13900 [Flavobacteriales bacterium]|nr:hypothetical protein [Flavobacteriales bacterium]